MKVELIVQSGAREKDLKIRLPTVIGRSRDVELKVRNTQVSRKHCEIYEEDDQLWVRDLGSANGTFVNKERIEGKVPLANGDLLNVGPVAMRVVVKTSGAANVPDDNEVLLDEPATPDPDTPGLSDLNYEETPDGSFIGITDDADADDDAETEPMGEPAADDAPAKKKKKQPRDKTNVSEDRTEVLEIAGEAVSEVVKGEDSALNDFFSGLN